LLVLGIIAALVVAAFIVYPKVQASQRAQAESNNIATIQAGVKALYTSASSFTGLTNTVAVQAKIFPDNMLSGSGSSATPINAFKGNVVGISKYRAFRSNRLLIYNNLFKCASSRMYQDYHCSRNFYTAGVGTAGNVKAAGEVLDVAKTATQCQSGGIVIH
jgi:type II secretory pathway pseudopilin PulG